MPRDNNQNQQFQALNKDEVKDVAGGIWVTIKTTELGAETWGDGGTVMSYTLTRRVWVY